MYFYQNFQVGTGDTFTLIASSAVAGQYYCHATVEGFPSVTSKPAGLNIILKPDIDISSKVGKHLAVLVLELRIKESVMSLVPYSKETYLS